MRVVVASLVAAAPLSLWGCGGDDTTASPGGGGGGGGGNRPGDYKPTTVQMAWDNHFGAFAEFNLDQIMWDYDETSEITVFNDACMTTDPAQARSPDTPSGMSRYVGTAQIRGFFDSLFGQLDRTLSNINNIGPKADSPAAIEVGNGTAEVREGSGNNIASANVFLTWRTVNTLAKPLKYATDTFSWRQVDGNFWIDHQTIVITDEKNAPPTEGATCSDTARRPVPADNTALYQAWDNHYRAFGNRSTTDWGDFNMMADYDANSIIAVYDNRDRSYNEHTGTAAIKIFFDTLFDEMRDKADPPAGGEYGTAGEGLRVGLLEIDEKFNTVFLVWSSRSHPRATDTFVFTDTTPAKIRRQNIVVDTTPHGQLSQSAAMVV